MRTGPSLLTAFGKPPRRSEYADSKIFIEECSRFLFFSGALNCFELEARVGTPYKNPERQYVSQDFDLPPDVVHLAERHGFEPIDFEVLFGDGTQAVGFLYDQWQIAGCPRCALVDPYYGTFIHPKDGGILEICFILQWLVRYKKHLPNHIFSEYRRRPAIVLDDGLELARHFIKNRISKEVDAQIDAMSIPEVLVNSVKEYHDTLMALCGCFIGSNCQLWFRGQNQDFMEPDPAELLREPQFLNYRQVRTTLLVPSLYRRAAYLWGTLDGLEKYVQSLGTWLTAAKAVLGDASIDRDNGEVSPWESPDHSGAAKFSTTMSVQDGEQWVTTTTDHHLEHDYHRKSLLLQHYGYPTQYLDITNQRDVALFFATRRFKFSGVKSSFETIAGDPQRVEAPVVYFFALNPDLHNFIRHQDLSMGGGFENLRARRQFCAVLGGSGLLARNYCARYLVAKVRLNFNPAEAVFDFSDHDLFPDAQHDKLFAELLKIESLQDANNQFQLYGCGT